MRVAELFDLRGRTALVTGAGRGIGRHLALGLAEAGADLLLTGRRQGPLEETATAIRALGREARVQPCDLLVDAQIEALADWALREAPAVDVLVNNAGTLWGAPTLEFPIEAWDKVFGVNVRGLFLLTRRIARHMVERRRGSIILVSSISGLRGAFEEEEPAVAYNASKGAVVTLTKDLGVKLARHGVRVNGIAPGSFRTDMMRHLMEDPERLARYEARIPMGRSGDEDDIKAVGVFLASEASRYVTGHTLVVDGGWLAL